MDKARQFAQKQLPDKAQRHKLFGSVEPGPRTKPNEKSGMTDVQNTKKDFLFDLDAVGIANVQHPITIASNLEPETQTTIASFEFSSAIDKSSKGTNMSRFTEQLQTLQESGFSINIETLKHFARDLAIRLDQNDAEIKVSFPWYYERRGPQSGLTGMNHADASIRVHYDAVSGHTIDVSLAPFVTTLCPCSKEISEYGAHNQRGEVSMTVSLAEDFDETSIDWKEQLLEAAESNASARLHPVLKRPDEKTVTEQAYENPRFVEDLARLVAADLYEMPFVNRFQIQCRNEESIHMHDAIASVSFDKQSQS
ncbi:GTP cyclohydrolase FolE2 [Barrientosiimonas marina]|uniref:GTP cyclohydrolase FolE2 n=1 Tax=Lentibacillus kimchii TaxID=1542911 RepID=A0ABW2V0G9_9BACI